MRTSGSAILVAGNITDAVRGEVMAGARPRIDVLELERRTGADLLDFAQLGGAVDRFIAERAGQWSLAFSRRVLADVAERDAVYATGEEVGFPLANLLRLKRAEHVRLVVRIEQVEYGRTATRRLLFTAWTRMALQRIDVIACRSGAYAQYLHSALGVPWERLRILPESTDLQFFDPDKGDDPPDESDYVMAAGLERRDYATLIEAASKLPVAVVIAAGSPWSKARLRIDGELPPNVRVGQFDSRQLRRLYAGARCVIVPIEPTMRACGGNVVQEARAMRRPVVATRTLGMLDYIDDGETGLLARPKDADDLLEKVRRVLDDSVLAERLGEHGHRAVRNRFSLDDYVEGIVELMEG